MRCRKKTMRMMAVTGAAIAVASSSLSAQVASLSKGQQILVNHGFQINGIIANTGDAYHLSTLQSMNYTAPMWAWTTDVTKIQANPTALWTKWFDYTVENDLPAAELPYKSSLATLCVGDEQNLANSGVYNGTVSWFTNNRGSFPNTMLYTNQWGTEIAEGTMINFVAAANPDAVNFDNYPYVVGGGSFIQEEYEDLSKYRRLGLGSYIGANGNAPRPYGTIIQTYATSGDNRRAPSDSEMRLQVFQALTCGYTFLGTFTYNSGASTLFDPVFGGDNHITTYGTQFTETARQARNLAPALVKLISKGANNRFIPGQDSAGVTHPMPNGWSNWAAGAEGDPYTTSISVLNTGTKNNTHPGDVLVGYFNPMLESYDGGYANELYFMVTNALDDPTGTVVDCKQQITMNFNFGASGINSLLRLNRSTGTIDTINTGYSDGGNTVFSFLSGTSYRLQLTLDGGTGDLFKFNDGASFVGVQQPVVLYWDNDANAANNNIGTGAGLGGAGAWDSSAKWFNGSSDVVLPANSDLIFYGTAGAVTLSAPQSAVGLTFKTNGYTLSGSTLTMTLSPSITVDSGVTATVASVVAGSAGITKVGSGTLVLNNAGNTYTGGTIVSTGTLAVSSDGSLGAVPGAAATNVTLGAGATLRFDSSFSVNANRQVSIGSGSIIDTQSNTVSIAGIISGTSLVKNGNGLLWLAANNTYAGPTTVNGGTLAIRSASLGTNPATPTTNLILNNGSTLRFDVNLGLTANRNITLGPGGGIVDTQTFTNTFAGVVSGTSLTKIGAGTLVLSNGNSYSGTTINGGAIQVGADSNLGDSSGGVTFGGGALNLTSSFSTARAITVNSGGGQIDNPVSITNSISGAISGTGALTKTGSGTLVLNMGSNNTSMTGGFNVNGGILQIGDGGTLGFLAAPAFNYGYPAVNIASGATVKSKRGNGINIYEAFTGAGGVVVENVSPSNTFTLAGNNTYTGPTTVTSGTFRVGVGDGVGRLASSGVAIAAGASFQVQVDANWTYAGVISGIGTFQKNSANGGKTLYLTGANTYTGTTAIQTQAGNTLSIGAGGTTGSIASLSVVTNTGTVLQFFRSNDLTYAGNVSGNGALTQLGTGALTLSGSQTYTGATTVSGGKLIFGNSLTQSASLTIQTGATAELAAGGNKVIKTPSLTITGTGSLDLNNNKLIVAGGATPSATLATIKSLIIAGRNVPVGGVGDGTWGGRGITSNSAHNAFVSDGIESRALGYSINSDLPLGAYATFGGQPVAGSDILVRFTRMGDADLDGKCGDSDVTLVGAFYDNGATTSFQWCNGDFNYDGRVDDGDVTLLGAFYDESAVPLSIAELTTRYGTEFAAAFAAGQAMTPEPSSLLFCAAIPLLFGRRRSSRSPQ